MALLWWGSGCFGENCKSEQNPQNAHLSHLSHLSLIHINSGTLYPDLRMFRDLTRSDKAPKLQLAQLHSELDI